MKSWLEDNNVEMYSIHNEGKSVVAERFIRTLKNKIYEYMTSISKNVYIDKLDDIVNKYNNANHRTIRMKPVDVKPSTYIDFNKENNKEGPKFKDGDYVRISKTFLQKAMFQIGLKKFFNVISDFNGETIFETFDKKELQKTNQKGFSVDKEIKRKYHKLYVKWKGYNNTFNSWIDKKDIL